MKVNKEDINSNYLALRSLKIEGGKEFEELILKIKDEKIAFNNKINLLVNQLKTRLATEINMFKKQELTIKKLERLYTVSEEGFMCKKCKRKFTKLAGMHIHLGRGDC